MPVFHPFTTLHFPLLLQAIKKKHATGKHPKTLFLLNCIKGCKMIETQAHFSAREKRGARLARELKLTISSVFGYGPISLLTALLFLYSLTHTHTILLRHSHDSARCDPNHAWWKKRRKKSAGRRREQQEKTGTVWSSEVLSFFTSSFQVTGFGQRGSWDFVFY